MPVIKSAKKKLRKDKKVTVQNNNLRKELKIALKEAVKKPSEASAKKAFKIIDKATKKNIIHKNKGARLKSKLSKLTTKKTEKADQPKKPTAKKVKKKATKIKSRK
jgi:small subunit ribosomal protein S20